MNNKCLNTDSVVPSDTITDRTMTCVVCPIGCEMTIKHEGKTLISVEGNTCKRGAVYAKDEICDPRRTLTSTVRIKSRTARLLPVKTSSAIPKDKLAQAMKILNGYHAKAPVKVGDLLIVDFIESGISLVACKDID